MFVVSRRKMFGLITAGLLVFLLINLFIPIIGDSTKSYSMWSQGENSFKILIIIELVAGIAVCLLQFCNVLLDYKFTYFPIGFYFSYYMIILFRYIDADSLKFAKAGLWLGILFSIGALATTIIGNFMGNEANPQMFRSGGNQPIGYDPKTGRPIYMQNNPPMYNQNMGNNMGNNNMGPPMYR